MPALFRWIFFGCLNRIAATLLTLVAIFLIAEAFDKARYLGHGIDAAMLIEYLLLKIPFMISEFMPVVVLLAASIFLVELSRHQELVAMRAAGLGVNKVLVPLLIAASLAAFVTFAIGEWVTPTTNQRLDKIDRVNIHHLADTRQGVQWLKDGQRFFRLQPLGGGQFYLIMLKTDNKGHWLERLEAAKASFSDGNWHMQNVSISRHPRNGVMTLNHIDHLSLAASVGPETADPPEPRHMRLLQLNAYAYDLERAGLAAAAFRFSLHRKLAVPFSCLIMVVLAVALCMQMGGRLGNASWGIIAAISLGLASYVMGTATQLLTLADYLPPIFSAWLPNMLTLGFAGFLLLHREKY
ncbi:MAG: LptF/LptG family permease [Mariprofundaceae bacterium]|nr:LptF/LptG family permease [Mariprofundaceae bacterium]